VDVQHERHGGQGAAPAGAASGQRRAHRRRELAVFSHGQAEQLQESDAGWAETLGHWSEHYGSSPLSWGEEVRLYRLRPHWMVGYAFERAALLARRGITG
jgi:hypothetical protein